MLLLWLAVDGILAFIPASIATHKGRTTYGGWWFYGFIFFPIALIHSLVMEPLPGFEHQEQRRETPPAVPRRDIAGELARLEEQRMAGLITDKTYEHARSRLQRGHH